MEINFKGDSLTIKDKGKTATINGKMELRSRAPFMIICQLEVE